MLLSNVGQDILDALQSTLGGWGMWSAIIATMSVICLGFFLTAKGIFKKEWEKVLVRVVMVVGLPALALNGFLTNASLEQLKEQMAVLLTGFLFYTIMMFASKFFFFKYEKDLQDTFSMCVALASTTFFGTPIALAIYGNDATIPAAIFNVPYRVFLYTMAFMIMSKKPMASTTDGHVVEKKSRKEMTSEELAESKQIKVKALKNIFLNPILICTFLGLFIWITQLIPGIEVLPGSNGEKYSVLRIDILFPPIKTILTNLAGICTPLAWLAIGMTMAKGNLKESFKDKKLWYAASIKVLVAPLIILLLIVGVAGLGHASNWFTFSKIGMAVMVIMTAAPPANVVVAYSITFEKGAKEASNLTSLSTFLSIVTLPIWVIIVTASGALPIFG